MRSSAKLGLAVFATLAVLAILVRWEGAGAQSRGAGAGGGQEAAQPENVLAGTIELHQHHDPDEMARSMDIIDAALYARLRGMRGVVFKSHGQETAGVSWLAAKMVPGLEVISVIDLNLSHGGLNKYAVEEFGMIVKKPNNPASHVGLVMFPSLDSCYQAQVFRANSTFLPPPWSKNECVRVSQNGQLVPAAVEIIGLIKKYGLVLSTGHQSPEECILLAREGQRQGVRMTVPHANLDPPGLQPSHMQEVAKLGMFVEFSSMTQRPSDPTLEARNTRTADLIRKLGPQYAILETDLGQANNEPGPDGLAAFIMNMRAKGFTKAETDMMTKTNPAKLLGFPALPAGATQ